MALAETAAVPKPRLTFVGHATVLMEGTETTLLTDPFFKSKMLWLKRRVPAALAPDQIPPLDAVLNSHTHPDHFDTDALEKLTPRPLILRRPSTPPEKFRDLLGSQNSKTRCQILSPGENFSFEYTDPSSVHVQNGLEGLEKRRVP
jgi:L-ascorbate metabolism protein UlaG (beta-lactamase superfamily)